MCFTGNFIKENANKKAASLWWIMEKIAAAKFEVTQCVWYRSI